MSIHSSQLFYQGREKILSVLDSVAMISGLGYFNSLSVRKIAVRIPTCCKLAFENHW